MSNASKYRKKAVEYEQLKQFDRAVSAYVRTIEENENASEEVDVALFNKVGDLTLRQGRVSEAVTYYERAVEHYVNNSLFDNAIALCNKILRNAPGRSNVYFSLGRICGRKGLRSDATRNFLEYATRMQQEGRVDEGMRALAEVADLMPELTEVRRLVEEHAARAGISLTRRRETPARVAAQTDAEPVRSFGLSKDLVFLEIDYDAVKSVRGRTPPPQPLVSADAAKFDVFPAPQPAAAAAPTARLEDLMIFDPRNSANSAPTLDDTAEAVVVDGASILKPYVDPETPVVSLADLEPTGFKETPEQIDVVESAPISDILQRGVAPRAPGDEVAPEQSVVVTRVPTEPNFPVITLDENVVALDGVESGISAQLFSELPVAVAVRPSVEPEAVTALADAVALPTDAGSSAVVAVSDDVALPDVVALSNAVALPDVVAVSNDVAVPHVVAVSDDVSLPDVVAATSDGTMLNVIASSGDVALPNVVALSNEIDLPNSHELSNDIQPAIAVELPVAVEWQNEVNAPDTIERETPDQSVQADGEIAAELPDVLQSVAHEIDREAAPNAIVNFAFDAGEISGLPNAPLEGFTADDESVSVADATRAEPMEELIVSEIETVGEVPPEAGVLPSLDFDAMLELASPDVPTVADLEVEEFAPASGEISVMRLTSFDEESPAELVDAFESEADLPPLILPQPIATAEQFDEASSAELEFVDSAAVELEFVDSIDASAVELQFVGSFDAPSVDLEFLEPADASPVELEFLDATESAPLELISLDIAATSVSLVDLDINVASGTFDVIDLDAATQSVVKSNTGDVFEVVSERPANGLGELVFLDVPPALESPLTPIEVVAVEADSAHAATIEATTTNDTFATDDLGDLFGDTGVHTAVVAAEATLVASSRCAELQSASDADSENFVLRRRLAEALFEAGNRDAAISELSAALAGAELVGALTDAADIADELVRVAGDEVAHHQKRLELAIRLNDQTRLRDAYLDLADMLVRRGEDLRAKAVYARVLEIDPYDDRARTALGDAAPPAPAKPGATGTDDGHVSLADWLRDDDEPTSTRLRMREPDVTGDEQDDFNALLKHFKEGVARSLGEDDYESHYDLGVAYKEMGLLDDAIGEFQMALRSRNNRLAAYEALGQCFLEQQSYKVAVTVLSRALHEPAIQDEQRVGILYLLGYSCEVLQRFDEARSYFQRVYATDIHFRDVAQRLADLERTVR